MQYEPGTLLAFKWDEKNFGVCKVIAATETNKEPIISIIAYSNWFETIPGPSEPEQLKPLVLHMPMIMSAMQATGCMPIGSAEVKPEELKGYEHWLGAWKDRRAGFFEIPVPHAVDHIVEAMAQVNSGSSDSAFKEKLRQRWQNDGL